MGGVRSKSVVADPECSGQKATSSDASVGVATDKVRKPMVPVLVSVGQLAHEIAEEQTKILSWVAQVAKTSTR